MPPKIHAKAKGIRNLEGCQSIFLSILMTVAYALVTRYDIAVYVTALQTTSMKATVIHDVHHMIMMILIVFLSYILVFYFPPPSPSAPNEREVGKLLPPLPHHKCRHSYFNQY